MSHMVGKAPLEDCECILQRLLGGGRGAAGSWSGGGVGGVGRQGPHRSLLPGLGFSLLSMLWGAAGGFGQ